MLNNNNFYVPQLIEQKHVFPNIFDQTLTNWLRLLCIKDSRFPFNSVFTLYYDTPALNSYRETLDREFVRTKVRLRWYMDANTIDELETVPCYIEVKQKHGEARLKKRAKILLKGHQLTGNPFADPVILNLGSQILQFITNSNVLLVPVLLLQYQRHRFFDPITRSRISLDTHIQSVSTNPTYISTKDPITLKNGVLEIKGRFNDLPYSLQPLKTFLTSRGFSKYGRCCELLLSQHRRFL